MKILVPFKRVPQLGSAAPGEEGEQWIINPFDEIAIEEALRIKERGEADEVVGVTISPPEAEEQIRAALAIGLDRAIRVNNDEALDPYAVAKILVEVVHKEQPDLIIMGKQAADDDAGQVGGMLAGRLNWPQATFISKLELVSGAQQAQCTRETDDGLEVILVSLPAVVTTDLRLNEPRYVSMAGLMKARRRPIEVIGSITVQPRTTILYTQTFPRRSAGVRVESVEDLVVRLRDIEKVI
jgi:electron transfer flavoprotein beta subunit